MLEPQSALLSSESQSTHTLVQVRPFHIQDPCGRRHIPICLFQNMQDAIALGIFARFLQDVARIEIRFQANFKGNGFNTQDIRGIQNRHPLYRFMTSAAAGDIQWNFEKFLIGRDGKVLKRYPPQTSPRDKGLMQDIADAL